MQKTITNELKKLDTEIARRLFSISKEKNIDAPPSPLQGRIMKYLVNNKDKEIYQKDLEDIFKVSKATVSSVLLSMENNKLIKRITLDTDARSKKIVLAENSQKVYEDMKIVFQKLNEELENGLSKEEVDNFYKTIEKMYKNIKNDN